MLARSRQLEGIFGLLKPFLLVQILICFVDVYQNHGVHVSSHFILFTISAYGVNDTLASYMTSILDSGYVNQYRTYESSTSIGETYIMMQNHSEHQLNRILRVNNFTLLELFEALAVR